MGVRQWLKARFDAPVTAKFDSAPRPIADMLAEMMRGTGTVGREEALGVPAVLRGRNMICSISTLPLEAVTADNRVVDHPLLRQVDDNVPNVVTLAMTIEDLLFEGVSWWRITGFGWDGYPVGAVRYEPGQVSQNPPTGYEIGYLPSGLPTDGVIWMGGKPVPHSEVIKFDSPNPPLLRSGQRAIRRAIALDQAAEMYANEPRPMDYFTPADGVDPADDDEIASILDKWRKARRQRSTAYVPAALSYNEVQQPTPADLQLVQLQQRATLDIANALGVDPEDLGISTTSRTYLNGVDRRKDRVNDVLAVYMKAITDRLSMPDVVKRGVSARFNLDDYLKADPKTRAEVQQVYVSMGVTDAAEVRKAEGLPPRAIRPAVPAPSPRPIPVTVGEPMREIEAGAPVEHTFSRHTGLTFDSPDTATFAVDAEARTITGLAVPWNQAANSNGRRWRFARGSLKYAAVNRVKLLRDHDNSQAIGKAVKLDDTDAGLVATFRVSPGRAGDEALALALDGVLDGLSIGVDFHAEHFSADPKIKGASLVHQAALREVSLTAVPSFDDSRLTSVRASDQGGNMRCTKCGQIHADGVTECVVTPPVQDAAPVQLSAEQFSQLLAQHQPTTERAVVNPTTTSVAMVSEPAPYRFDRQGNIHSGTHEFSSDLFAAGRGDLAANDRVMEFVRAQFDTVTTDVNELNPVRNRPDMYVDQRSFRYPVWQAINKGTLSDITPFTFPKFSSTSGLVGAHTEGTEPTPGALVTTSQTVTPTAISGKAKITRETWDQGGNPQVSNLIWRQMLKGWYEALEAAAVAVLDAASPTGIDLSGTPGLADEGLDQALTSAFAALQFVRGGFSMDNLFTQIDLYKALVAATDADGRRLYPALGPANATGTARSRFAALDINGVTALPAWALAATGAVAASSYLFDSEAVHGWASNPQRLDFNIEVAHVYIGLWGYKATAISDIAGVREIIYDPS